MTTNWQEVVNDPQIHVVIELGGGTGIVTGHFGMAVLLFLGGQRD
jgi:hypothetical protein